MQLKNGIGADKGFSKDSDTQALAQDTKVIIKKIKRHIESGCKCCAEALR
jgi:hypothetical protein